MKEMWRGGCVQVIEGARDRLCATLPRVRDRYRLEGPGGQSVQLGKGTSEMRSTDWRGLQRLGRYYARCRKR